MSQYVFNKLEKKYKPTKIEEIIGNKSTVNSIKKWLLDYDKNKTEQLKNPKKRKKNIKIIESDDEIEDTNEFENEIQEDEVTEVEDIEVIEKAKDEKNSTNNAYSCLLISGNHGSGKSACIIAILNSLGYELRKINLNKISSSKKLNKNTQPKKKNKNENNLEEYIETLLKGEHIYEKILQKKNDLPKKFAIVIDRVESTALPAEKKIITTILKINEKYWYSPVIFITNNKHSKILTFLKANTHNVYFSPPTNLQIFGLLMKICNKEKFTMEEENKGGKETADKIVEYSQNDYRKLFSILQEVTLVNKFIKLDVVESHCLNFKKKDTDSNIYISTSKMMIRYDKKENFIKEYSRLYNSDKTTYPLMLQENYPVFLTNFCNKKEKKTYSIASEISNSMAIGDLIDNYIFSDQNWDMVDVHGHFSCISPAFLMSTINKRGTLENVMFNLKYPQDFNRTSIKQINRRNVTKSSEYFTNFSIQDFISLGEILNTLIKKNKIDECVKILKYYKIDEKILDSLLKINKIIDTKSSLSSQTKRKFADLLKNNI